MIGEKDSLKEYQQLLIEIFRNVVKICGDNDITFFLTDGSCLGAVRHSGIIPWDDDIDIAIFSSDYDKFYEAMDRSLDSKYLVERNFDQQLFPTHTDIMGRIYNKEHLVYTDIFSSDKRNTSNPWIDVMLICGCPKSLILTVLHFYHILLLKVLLKLSNPESIGFNSDKNRGKVERLFLWLAKHVNLSSFINEIKISSRLKKVLLKYDPHTSDRVFAYSSDYREKEIVPYSYYGHGREIPFEGIVARVPAEAEKYLTKIYGDYMEIPPLEMRHRHIMRIIK